jgi:hypothetical protein
MLHLQNKEFKAYSNAMERLANPPAEDQNLPFGPLPAEIPYRLKDEKSVETDIPIPGESALSFTAAQVILSYLDTIVEADELQRASVAA